MLISGGVSAAAMTASGSSLDVSSILSSVGGGGVGGAVVMAIVGLIKAMMAKSNQVLERISCLHFRCMETDSVRTAGSSRNLFWDVLF
jgi:hypothetical protein